MECWSILFDGDFLSEADIKYCSGAWHTTADSHGSSNKSFAGQHSSLPQASSPIPWARSAYLGTKGPGVGQSVGIEAHSGATATKNCEGNKKIGNRGSHTSTAGDDLRKCGYMETGLDSYIGSRPDYSIPLADCNGPVEGAARVIGSINPRVGGSASKSKRFLTSDNASRPGYSETSHHTADLHAYKLPSTPKSHLSGTPNYDIFSGSLGLEDDTANYDWFLTQKRETDVAKDDFTIDLLGFDGGAVGTSLPNLNKALGPAMASGHRNPLKSDKVSSWEETAIGGNEAAKLSRPHIAARQRQAVCPLDLIKQPLQSWKVSPHAVHSNIPLQGEASSSAAPPTPAKQREEVQAPAQSPEGFESFPSPPYQERLKQVPGDLESLQSSRNIPRPAQKQQIDSQRLPAPQSLQTSSEAITSNENDKRPYLEGLLLGEENLSVSPPTSSNERRFYEMLMGLDQNPSLGTAHDDTNEFLGFEGIPSVMNEANYSIPPEGAAYDFMDGQPWQSPNQNGRRQAASIVSDRGSENLMLPTGLATLQYDHIDIGLLQQREYFPDPYLGFDATHYEIGRRHSQNLEHADPLDMHPVGDRMARGTATLFQPSERDQTPMHQGHLAHEMPAFIGHTAQSPNPPMSAASVATLAAGATEDLFHEIYSPYSSAMSPWQQALPPTGFGG